MSAAQKLAEMRNQKSDESAKKADDQMAAGKKHASTGFLGLAKPDWDRASRAYAEAAKLYALCGPAYSKKVIEANVAAAEAYEKQDEYHSAGQHFEKAANELAKSAADIKTAANMFRSGGRMYRLSEAPDRAAGLYMKAASVIGEVDVKFAMELCLDACSVFEDEKRAMFAMDTFKNSINYMVRKAKYPEAIALLHRQNAVYQMVMKTFEGELYKNLLTILVLRFVTAEYDKAEEEYKTFQSMHQFGESQECVAADGLIDAWTQGSAEALAKTVKLQVFTFLANSVSVLARQLTFNEVRLKEAQAKRAAENAKIEAEETAKANEALPKNKDGELDLT